tara:strand:+ start:1730 stop:2074 length:345 start_codon:yes stop_codon:yes gene_type:complete
MEDSKWKFGASAYANSTALRSRSAPLDNSMGMNDWDGFSIAEQHRKWIGKRVAVKLEATKYIVESCASAIGTAIDVELTDDDEAGVRIWVRVRINTGFGTCLVNPGYLRLLEQE